MWQCVPHTRVSPPLSACKREANRVVTTSTTTTVLLQTVEGKGEKKGEMEEGETTTGSVFLMKPFDERVTERNINETAHTHTHNRSERGASPRESPQLIRGPDDATKKRYCVGSV